LKLSVCFADALKKRKGTIPKQWTTDEKKIVHEYFSEHIKINRLPKKGECVDFLERNKEIIKGRQWSTVKDYVRNYLDKKKRFSIESSRIAKIMASSSSFIFLTGLNFCSEIVAL
jgi:hypothetical protein